MALQTLALIGFGNIAKQLVMSLSEHLDMPFARVDVLVRPETPDERIETIESACVAIGRDVRVHTAPASFEQCGAALVIECAGHQAVADHVPRLLSLGHESIVTSVGALGDASLASRLREAARQGGTRLVVPSGAIGALDIVAALRYAGIDAVDYRSRKPPAAWQGTPAESAFDLATVSAPMAFYEGDARAAVLDYPKNANVAAALALAGIGFERTRVTLIADPDVTGNVHEFDVTSAAGSVSVRIEGKASVDNPKTSMPTVHSLVREVMNRVGAVVI